MYNQLQRFLATILLFSLVLQSCTSNAKLHYTPQEKPLKQNHQKRHLPGGGQEQGKAPAHSIAADKHVAAPHLVSPHSAQNLTALPKNSARGRAAAALAHPKPSQSKVTAMAQTQRQAPEHQEHVQNAFSTTAPEPAGADLKQPFTASRGQEVQLYYQQGQWKAQVTERLGHLQRKRILPVRHAHSLQLENLLTSGKPLPKHLLHVVKQGSKEFVYIGTQGLAGGTNGQEREKIFNEALEKLLGTQGLAGGANAQEWEKFFKELLENLLAIQGLVGETNGQEREKISAELLEKLLDKKLKVNSKGKVQQVKDKKQWIRMTKRALTMRKKLSSEDELYELFNYEHHIAAAIQFFSSFGEDEPTSVVYGHKCQGKSQFLFFLVNLLQELGEIVIYLDNTMLPFDETKKIKVNSTSFCGKVWMQRIHEIAQVSGELENFSKEKTSQAFGIFLEALGEFAEQNNKRVWMIVDEVVEFSNQKFNITLPKEQIETPFSWIVTGSAGIGSWVSKQHLEKFIFDLPLFSKEESFEYAKKLSEILVLNLSAGIGGVPYGGLSDWLEERFGGVVGYITELFFAIQEGTSIASYLSELDKRIDDIILSLSEGGKGDKDLAESWLNRMRNPNNTWQFLRNVGLCGSNPPRGVIFSKLLEALFAILPEKDKDDEHLTLVQQFRSEFGDDPGLDGCLLELEEILKLKKNYSLEATCLALENKKWVTNEKGTINLPSTSKESPLKRWLYREGQPKLVETNLKGSISSWNLIEVPSGFDVIDVAIVNKTDSPRLYGIQITRSQDPFAKHHTFETASENSKKKIQALKEAICKALEIQELDVFFTMLAPNCNKDLFKPPAGHLEPYYFSPANLVFDYNPTTTRKRKSHPVPPRTSALKKAKSKCCRCSNGACENCQCVQDERKCSANCSPHCQNRPLEVDLPEGDEDNFMEEVD